MIGPKQRFLPDNTQRSQETDINFPGGNRTRNPSKRAAADPRLMLFFHERVLAALRCRLQRCQRCISLNRPISTRVRCYFLQRCYQGHGAANATSRGTSVSTWLAVGVFLPRCCGETVGGGAKGSSERQCRSWKRSLWLRGHWTRPSDVLSWCNRRECRHEWTDCILAGSASWTLE